MERQSLMKLRLCCLVRLARQEEEEVAAADEGLAASASQSKSTRTFVSSRAQYNCCERGQHRAVAMLIAIW